MKIIVLDSLLRQMKSKNNPTDAMEKILNEFQNLSNLSNREKDGWKRIKEYINNHHGIKMKGVDKIFKYELTSGDRLLFAHSEDLPWLHSREDKAFVLLRFAKHDVQGIVAKKFDLNREHEYYNVEDIVDNNIVNQITEEDITVEDDKALTDVLSPNDYTEWHKIYVIEDMQKYAKLSLDDMDIFLSNEQYQCITDFSKNVSPTLIVGGAGTGKTLIAVHLLINYVKNNKQGRACYFTQSPELRTKVKDLFEKYSGNEETYLVEFNDINEFCVKQLGLKHEKVVYTHEFLEFLKNQPDIMDECREKDISPIDIWAEIRGVIKGCMSGDSGDWTRVQPLSQDDFNSSIETLVNTGYFERDTNDKKIIRLAGSLDTIKKRFASDTDLTDEDKENLNTAINYFSSFDHNKRTLTQEEYQEILEERTTLKREQRQFAWNVCVRYEEYLRNENLYDENDLIREMFKKRNLTNYKYDFIVVDEVQDYTELQIYFIRTLSKGNKIVFAGDEHQNINPASFSESRIKSLFYHEQDTCLRIIRLQKNYRCPKEIIEKINELAEIRREAIGRGSAENEEPEVAIRSSNAIPKRLTYSSANIDKCICELIQYPKAVILVPDQNSKTNILKKIEQLKDKKLISEDTYDVRSNNAVFTVAEIKGVEYEFVLCLDLISAYKGEWQKIIQGVHQQTKYRFYFNLLYVAMTRAQKYLCFVDERLSSKFDEKLNFSIVNNFDASQLYFDQLSQSIEDWIEQGLEYEKNGKYEEAVKMYERGHAKPESLYRCKYHIAIKKKNYNRAMEYALLLKKPDLCFDYLKDITSPDMKKMIDIYISLTEDPLNCDLRESNINELVESCVQPENINIARDILLKVLQDALMENVDECVNTLLSYDEVFSSDKQSL